MTRPEIVNRIGRFMDQRSLLCALFVSHQWHDCLLPQAWASIKLKTYCMDYSFPDIFDKRRHLIQSLDIVFRKGPSDYGPCHENHYPNLSSLTILIEPGYCDSDSDTGDGGWGDNRLDGIDFIQNNTTSLRYLELTAQTPSSLLDVLVDCLQLEELHLSDQACSPNRWMDLFETLWSRLRVLSLGVCAPKKLSYSGYRTKVVAEIDVSKIVKRLSRAKSTKLEELSLTMDWQYLPATFIQLYLQLIQKSPNLERLSWFSKNKGERTPMDYIIGALQSKQLYQQLKSLGFYGDYSNPDLEILLKSMTSLQELDLGSTSFDVASWGILKARLPRYLTTLTSLSLAHCDEVTGAMVLDMLFCLPNLVTFVADFITDLDLMEDTRSWTCGQRLKKLQLAFVQTRYETLHLFLARIAKLEQLEDWSLDETCIRKKVGLETLHETHFQLTLENGLGDLKTLRNLKRFRGFGLAAHWGEAEVLWALEHWVSLEEISSVNIDEGVRKSLQQRYISAA